MYCDNKRIVELQLINLITNFSVCPVEIDCTSVAVTSAILIVNRIYFPLQSINQTNTSVSTELGRVFPGMGGGGPIQASSRRTPYARNGARASLPVAPIPNTSISTVAALVRGIRRRSASVNTNEGRNTDLDAEPEPEVNYKTYDVFVLEKVIANNIPTAS